MKKKGYIFIKILMLCVSMLGLIFLTGATQIESKAMSGNTKTIRVGYPIQAGLTMKDENGKLSGYTYDYIMELSQFTGWNFEFIFFEGDTNSQLLQSMEMLRSGELDLLGGLNYSEALTEYYTYPGYCYGINYCGLFVPEESGLRESSLYNSGHIKVGVHNKEGKKDLRLEQYAQMNNLNIEQVVVKTTDDFYRIIEEGSVDALLSTDLAMAHEEHLYAIAHFSPVPFYLATTKGKTDIVQQLDYAIATIDQVNPNFTAELYNKYFSSIPNVLSLTAEEENYVNTSDVLEVVMYDNKPPFQSIDPKTGEPIGITVEVLEYIAESLNLTFHYNTVSTYKEYTAFLESGKADIAADTFSNYQDAKDLKSSLTLPWYSVPINQVFLEGTQYNKEGKVAVPYFLKNVLPVTADMYFYDSVEECLEAVQNGTVDYSYIDEFCSQYYLNMTIYNDIMRIGQTDIANQKLCFGISETESSTLHTILNKSIRTLPKDKVNDIIYRNTYQQRQLTVAEFMEENRNVIIAALMTLFALILLIWVYVKERRQKRIGFENKRYHAISTLANEYFYEYDVLKDELNLSEKCADYFSCEEKIVSFSQQLSTLTDEKNRGIWQLSAYIISSKEGSCELSCEMPDCSRQWFEIVSTVIINSKKQYFLVGKIKNIQQVKAEQMNLKQQASFDGLTGIYNISAFKEKLLEQYEEHEEQVFGALMILDVDNFKQINDQFGHYKGDAVLAKVARIISGVCVDGLHGRLGGDEFVVFVNSTDREILENQCAILCKTMRKETERILGVPFSFSIGVTWVRKDASYNDFYKEADTALYQMKATTKNSYAFYS